jgi:hypothetical protein
MKQSLPGLLLRVGEIVSHADRQHGPGYQYAIGELIGNLRELRDRTKAGDMAAIEEFFSVYVFGDESSSTEAAR